MLLKKPLVMKMNDKCITFMDKDKEVSIDLTHNEAEITHMISDIKSRKLYVVIDGHELFIKHLTLPRLNKNDTEKMIYNELNYYINDMKNVVFSYIIYSIHESEQEILAFCLNWNKLDFLKQLTDRNNDVSAVYMIQFCFLNYYKSLIKNDKFMLVFQYNGNAYILLCSGGNMTSNKVIKLDEANNDDKVITEAISDLYKKYALCDKIQIYFANIEIPPEIIRCSSTYDIIRLAEVSNENIVNYCMRG